MAWVYPHAVPGFNPVVVDDVMYTAGRDGSALIALDASTGKEIWIHDGLPGLSSRGINYWESEDGQDRRLLFSIRSYLQAIDEPPVHPAVIPSINTAPSRRASRGAA